MFTVRRGDIPIEDGTRLVSILRVLSEILRDTDLEARMAEIEGTAKPQRSFGNIKRAA